MINDIISGISYFMPLFAFLIVFIIIYALLSKTKVLGENSFVHVFVSLIAGIFVFASPKMGEFTKITLTWVAVFIVSLVFILLVLAFMGKKVEDAIKSPLIAYLTLIILIAIFLFSAIKVFGSVIKPYVPGQIETGGSPELLKIKHLLFNPSVLGTIIALIIGAAVAAILTRKE